MIEIKKSNGVVSRRMLLVFAGILLILFCAWFLRPRIGAGGDIIMKKTWIMKHASDQDLASYPALLQLKNFYRLEREVDFSRAGTERVRLIKQLTTTQVSLHWVAQLSADLKSAAN